MYECNYCSELEETYNDMEAHLRDTHAEDLLRDIINYSNPNLEDVGAMKEIKE